jgi:pimeloyl-ACP methyl ester carboxylesterase
MAYQNPVIVVPGITASKLLDAYVIDPETVWAALTKNYDRIALHPDNLRYERDEPARVLPDQVFDIPYGELIKELRHDLSPREDQPTPVYPFAYDWRQPLDATELQLEAFVDEVMERTRLMPKYNQAGYADDPHVDLIGHSMGGLLIAGYLQRKGKAARVGKVATLGSPFRGSFEAVLKVTTGLATLGNVDPSSREREVARLTPALYYLVPNFADAVQADPGLSADLFDPQAWQPTILETLTEYVRLYGLSKADRKKQAETLFTGLLKQAQDYRTRAESLDLGKANLSDADWLCIVGVHQQTRVRLHITADRKGPLFDLRSDDRTDGWKDQDASQHVCTGDGTVPYLGARCAFIPVQRIVCVSPEDFGYWEVGDRLLLGPVGLHGMLPKMNLIHRLIASHFTGKLRKGTWGHPPPDLPSEQEWDPPIEGLEKK